MNMIMMLDHGAIDDDVHYYSTSWPCPWHNMIMTTTMTWSIPANPGPDAAAARREAAVVLRERAPRVHACGSGATDDSAAHNVWRWREMELGGGGGTGRTRAAGGAACALGRMVSALVGSASLEMYAATLTFSASP